MAQFVFLYRGGERAAGSPERMQQRMEKWTKWFAERIAQGHIQDRGVPLARGGKLVGGTPKANVTDGPYAEKDLVMGFTLVEAADLAQAAALAASHPILDEGGCVEVRPVLAL